MRRLKEFSWHEPGTTAEACRLLAEHPGRTVALAGGTDLVMGMKLGKMEPSHVVNLKRIPSLGVIKKLNGSGSVVGTGGAGGTDGINWTGKAGGADGGYALGALTTFAVLERGLDGGPLAKFLAEAASQLGSPLIRNRATLGGNLCNASPAAEIAPALLALGATVRVAGENGEREVPLSDFFTGPGSTVLGPGEILTEVLIPSPGPSFAGAYRCFKIREALDIAVANVAVALCVGETGSGGARVIRRARIAMGAVAPTPVLAPKAGEALKGLDLGGSYPEEIDRRIKDAARLAADASRPITDIRASGEYRRHLVKVLAERALRSALESLTA